MTQDAEALAGQIARELIAQHGADVPAVLQSKIDELMASGDLDQLSAWFVIRNAVALELSGDATQH